VGNEQQNLPRRRYSAPDARLELGDGRYLTPGVMVRLRPADYVYDDDWMNPSDVLLKVTYIGDQWVNNGVEFLLLEGDQISGAEMRTRWRTVLVRLTALPKALTPEE
jgi:hypothetical protein